MMSRKYPPKQALPFLAGIAILSIASFLIRSPKPVGFLLRVVGAGAAIGYCQIEEKRRRIESGEEELDEIAIAMEAMQIQAEELENRKAQIYAEIEAKMLQQNAEVQAKLAEIDQEWNAIESQRVELTRIGSDLSARRAALEFEQQTWQKDAALRQQKLELELYDIRHEIEVREANLNAREQEFKTMTRTATLQAQELIAKEREDLIENHLSRIGELQHEQQKLIVDKQVLEERFVELTHELEAARAEAINEQEVAQQQIDEMVAQKQAELEAARQRDIEQLQADKAQYLQQVQAYIDHLQAKIDEQQAQLDELTEAPTFGAEDGYAGYIGNLILEAIRSFDGLRVYPHQCRALPWGSVNQPAVIVWLRLGDGTKAASVFAAQPSIEAKVAHRPIQMECNAKGFLTFCIGDVRGADRLPELPPAIEVLPEKIEDEIQITEPSPQRVENGLGRSPMFLVAGDPGSGKSTFVNNLITYTTAFFGRDVEFHINDLKFPDPDSRWKIRGQEVIPEYCLIQEVAGMSRFGLCIDGLEDMYASLLARKNKRLEDVANKREIRRFKKSVWIIDEAPALTDAYGKAATVCIKNTVRVGRGLDTKVIVVGQSHLCSDYGLKTSDLKNMTRIYLGADYAALALQGGKTAQITVSPERRKQLMAEIHARQKLASEQIERGELLPNGQPPAKYFGLIVAGGEAFLMTLPPPNAFDNLEVEEEDADKPLIPDEEIMPISKSVIQKHIEQEPDEEDESEEDKPKSKSTVPSKSKKPESKPQVSIDTSKLPALHQAIVEFVNDSAYPERQSKEWNFSELYSNSRVIKQAIGQTKASGVDKTMTPSKMIRKACFELVRDWKVGEIAKGPKSEKFKLTK